MDPDSLPRPLLLREHVCSVLEELILDGTLRPGDRLVETDLAERIGVSRGPIREALFLLERDGWIRVHPRRGAYVQSLAWTDLDDYFSVRILLETRVIELVIRRLQTDSEIATGISQLWDNISRLNDVAASLTATDPLAISALPRESWRLYAEVSREFHSTLAELSGSRILHEMVTFLGKRTRWFFPKIPISPRGFLESGHKELLALIESGKEKEAVAMMTQHLESIRRASFEAYLDNTADGTGNGS